MRTNKKDQSVVRHSPSSKDLNTEAEEYPLLGAITGEDIENFMCDAVQ